MPNFIHRGFRSFVVLLKKACRKIRKLLTGVKSAMKTILARFFRPEVYKNNPVLFVTDLIPLLIKIFIRRGSVWVIGILVMFGLIKTKLDDAYLPMLILLCNLALFASFPQFLLWFIADIVITAAVLMSERNANSVLLQDGVA